MEVLDGRPPVAELPYVPPGYGKVEMRGLKLLKT